jgi:hypothetical protein
MGPFGPDSMLRGTGGRRKRASLKGSFGSLVP